MKGEGLCQCRILIRIVKYSYIIQYGHTPGMREDPQLLVQVRHALLAHE
jgi:hypothetical protein